ncbi:MAG TPA: hypothetical protein VFX28_20160, partial [Methylomirabilota bacterium]|nr:hypothetical protein [Methylomirabilota bacterium]
MLGQVLKKLDTLRNPILVFAILLVVVLAAAGSWIPDAFRGLVWVVAVLALLIAGFEPLLQRLGAGLAHSVDAAAHASPRAGERPRVEAPAAPAPAPRRAAADAREAYLGAVIADCRPARLVGLDPQAADPGRGRLLLERLYVDLDTTSHVPVGDAEAEGGRRHGPDEIQRSVSPERARPLPALEALATARGGCMVLLGLPGAGKSTFVRYLALRMSQALQRGRAADLTSTLPGWSGPALLPLIVPLGRLAESLPVGTTRGSATLVERYVHAALTADPRTADYATRILGTLGRDGGLVLFDGLDEVADPGLRPVVVQAVEDFARGGDKTRCLVTCRTFSYTDARWQLAGWVTHELAPLDPGKIARYVEAWHTAHAELDPARAADYERKRQGLLAALEPGDRRRLAEIAPNPLILTLMAVVNTHEGDLPDTRAQVYERCVDLLLLRWELERSVLGQPRKQGLLDALGVTRVVLDQALREIAYRAHASREPGTARQGGRRAALVTEDLLRGILRGYLGDDARVQTFVDYCESANGLLMLQGVAPLPDAPPGAPSRQVYAFPHLTFEEYLAARHVGVLPNVGR